MPACARLPVLAGPPTALPCPALQERVAFWRDRLGFSPEELRMLLEATPRLLLYPIHEPKYQAKLRFLQGGWGVVWEGDGAWGLG